MWLLAHGRLGTGLDDSATAGGLPGAATVVAELCRRGDLIEYDATDGSAAWALGAWSLKPLGHGMGPVGPPGFEAVGRPGLPVPLPVPARVALVWQLGLTGLSIAGRVEALCDDDDAAVELSVLLGRYVPALIAAGLAFLDDPAGREAP